MAFRKLPGDDVLHQVVHVRFGNVLNPPCAEQWDNVAADAADVGRDRGGLLGATAFPKNEARLHVGDVLLAELANGHRATLLLPFCCGVIALGDVTQTDLCLAASSFRSPHPV